MSSMFRRYGGFFLRWYISLIRYVTMKQLTVYISRSFYLESGRRIFSLQLDLRSYCGLVCVYPFPQALNVSNHQGARKRNP